MVGVFGVCLVGLFGGAPGGALQAPGGLLQVLQSVSEYKFFSPGIQVDLCFRDFGVFQNATWILESSLGLRVAREGFEA